MDSYVAEIKEIEKRKKKKMYTLEVIYTKT